MAFFIAFHLVSSSISCPTLHQYVSISQVIEGMNMHIDNVKVVCEDWRKLNRLASFGAFCLVSSNILYTSLLTCVAYKISTDQQIKIIYLRVCIFDIYKNGKGDQNPSSPHKVEQTCNATWLCVSWQCQTSHIKLFILAINLSRKL